MKLGACLMGFYTDSQFERLVAKRSWVKLSTYTRGGEKHCNLIAEGPKSGAEIEGQTKTEKKMSG